MQTRERREAGIRHPINLAGRAFMEDKEAHFRWLRENAPVYEGRLSVLRAYLLSRYDDCVAVLKDSRFVRNRATARGGGRRTPFPMPKSVALVANSMILEDDPEHRRLRNLVHKAFTPRALEKLGGRIERLSHELLEGVEGTVDLIPAYCLPIPVTVIGEMMGVSQEDMPRFRQGMRVLTSGFSGWNLLRTYFWDMPGTVRFVRELIQRKREDPQDDILTALIQAEDEGQALSEDELVSMVFLLIIAGYETTVYLIANSVVALLEHPESLETLRARPELMAPAVEEVLRYNGPIQGTKPVYAAEDVTLRGVTIPKGSTVLPLLGSANHDPDAFPDPDVFDIERHPNRHLGFGQGPHYCLGAPLARMETRIALSTLLERSPGLRLAVEPGELRVQRLPLWNRYRSLPVTLG